MSYRPSDEQRDIIEATDPVLVVLGGAGTGKTATAAAAARAQLERADAVRPVAAASSRRPRTVGPERVLFLSFSRASVARITERSRSIVGPYRDRIEVTTFHALAWRIIQRFGGVADLAEPYLLTRAQAMLFPGAEALRYKDLVPRALDVLKAPAVREHLKARWSLIVCDEFQDTDDGQYALLESVRGGARLILLGDPNQCIYANLPDAVGVSPERLEHACLLPGARRVELPEASFRDPSGVIPAAAAAIRRREFQGAAVNAALESGRLQVFWDGNPTHEARAVARTVEELRTQGLSVAVFSHHNDALARLSDELAGLGVDHEITGLSESLGSSLDAQLAMAQFAAGLVDWRVVLQCLAIFVTSSVRGSRVPGLALQILGVGDGEELLGRRLSDLRNRLQDQLPQEALNIAAAAHASIGLPNKASAWTQAAATLRPMLASAARRPHGSSPRTPQAVLAALERGVGERRVSMLTDEATDSETAVQLMNLHQTKGREADATVVVLRAGDFFGSERDEPFEEGSRLMYVVFSRARQRIVVLIFGDELRPLVAPLVVLAKPL
jgi:DNA helicase-2/ATP-dependent DNA helicase PcrA